MSQPFLGQISMFAGTFAPRGYSYCSGQLVPIDQNDALFALIGTTYGGDGQTTFALPDMRGRLPISQGTLSGGSSYVIGQAAGTETVTLTSNQMPIHSHTFPSNSASGTAVSPSGGVIASTSLGPFATGATTDTAMNVASLGVAGGNQPHDNIMPFLCVGFIIAMEGIFPARN